MAAGPDMTAVIGVWGRGYADRLRAAVGSIRRQTVPVRIVLSEICREPLYADLAAELGAEHVSSPPASGISGSDYSPDQARNAGLACVGSGWVYFTDSDILFPSRRFFEQLAGEVCSEADNVAIYPAMRTVSASCAEELLRAAACSALPDRVPSAAFVRFQDGEFTPGPERERVRTFGGTPWAITEARLEKLRSLPYRGHGMERIVFWEPTIHFGALLARAELLIELGGYCMEFSGYGFGDVDMTWKALRRANVIRLYEARPDLVTLHVEHSRPYLSRIAMERNYFLHVRRKLKGFLKAVESDRTRWKELTARLVVRSPGGA